ncbi:unnamed protein product [Caenorhabditis angaria]|uniref:CYtochrome P450 family n=1 Tax=Caenorhabditis angaria TaxID=860376 RepID=A0A9P1IXB1_9PELO|nr:unnamed protein product [Caenorhabditis angaria]
MILILLLLFTLSYIINFYWKVSKYPKGPFPYPVVGNLLQFPQELFHLKVDELSKIYGPCFTVWMPLPIVVFADYEHIKEAFVTQGESFTYRSHLPPESLLQPHDQVGILMSDGDNWRLQRRTSLKILREFGLGKGLMEEQVKGSIEEMLEQLKNIENKNDVDIHWPIQLCVGNVINETLFGYHFSYKNPERFVEFVTIVSNHIRDSINKATLMLQCWPWMKYLPVFGEYAYHRIKRNIDKYQKFIEEEVNSQAKLFNDYDEPTNFVHAYMQQMKPDNGLDMKNLYASVLDFWLAGMETTSNSLRWHIAYMMKYPEIQQKVREEILSVVGVSRLPTMADKPNMPYTQAVIHEVQRHSNMVPFLASHKCVEDTIICGKKIPAGTATFPQIWSVLANDPVFDSPLQFNPSRYLLDDGKTTNKTVLDRSIPFSIGKRACVGEGLARMELFLIFSALLQKYEYVPLAPVDMSPQMGGVLTTKPYRLKLVENF